MRQFQAERARRIRASLIKFVKESLLEYRESWVHIDICNRLEKFSREVVLERSPRLMIFMPPRHGKSFIVSERFPVWHLCHNPTHQIIMATYGQTLSDKFSKRARSLSRSELVKNTFPDFDLDSEKQAIQEWETNKGGAYRSVGIGGGVTGTGCNILIIDDPIKNAMEANSKSKRENDWEWYATTAYTRLMPGAGICVIQTRWHEDDLSGRLISAMKSEDGDKWEIASYPAIAEVEDDRRKVGEALHPERYSQQRLSIIKRAIGVQAWNSLYQQRPSAVEGNMFKREWWKSFDETPKRFERLVQSWDCNFKGGVGNDFVVGILLGKIGADYYLLDLVRGQWDFVETIEQVKAFTKKHRKAKPILIEDAANGPAVISSLKGKISGIVAFRPEGSKEARAVTVTPICESGNVYLAENAPWRDSFIDETANFPKGNHDDQVDAVTQAIIYLEEEGKMAVFSNIANIFESGSDYVSDDWTEYSDKNVEIFFGIKWGYGDSSPHIFYALNNDGKTIGYKRSNAMDHSKVLDDLVAFIRGVCGQCQSTVYYEANGFGETMSKLMAEVYSLDWRPIGVKLGNNEIGSMVSFLKESISNEKLSLKPWSILFDQMAAFRCEETEKGTIVYSHPEGLSANAVYALMLAHEAWRNHRGEIVSAVINDLHKSLTKIYYSGNDDDDYD